MPHWLTLIDPKLLQVLAVAWLALAILLVGATMLWHAMGQDRSRVAVDKALLKRGRVALEAHAQGAESGQPSGRFGAWVAAAANLGRRWKEGRYGGFLLAPEDLALLDLCGFRNDRMSTRRN